MILFSPIQQIIKKATPLRLGAVTRAIANTTTSVPPAVAMKVMVPLAVPPNIAAAATLHTGSLTSSASSYSDALTLETMAPDVRDRRHAAQIIVQLARLSSSADQIQSLPPRPSSYQIIEEPGRQMAWQTE